MYLVHFSYHVRKQILQKNAGKEREGRP